MIIGALYTKHKMIEGLIKLFHQEFFPVFDRACKVIDVTQTYLEGEKRELKSRDYSAAVGVQILEIEYDTWSINIRNEDNNLETKVLNELIS